jgi:type I restriction enzyme S subunit
VARVVRGVTYGKGDVVQSPGPGDVPVLRAGNINGRLITDRDLVWLPRRAVSDDQILKAGDVVMCMSSGSASVVGKSALLKTEWVGSFGAFCAAVRTEPLRADPGFIAHVLATPAFRAFAGAALGNNIKNLNKSALEGYRIPLPPLDEQRRIVGLLDRAAEIRRRADAARAKARAIIPALFIDMFGDPATNPKGWPHLPFGQITNEFRYGTNQKCHDEAGEGSVPVLRIPNVIGGQIDWSDIKHAALPAKEREKTRLRVGDLLFVRTNGNPDYIGRCAYFDAQTDASYASYLIRARLAESMSPIFAIHHFNHPRFRPLMLRMGKTTAGNYNLSVEGLSALPVMVPPLALQAAFAETAQRLDSLARQLDAAAAKAEAMAAGLSAEVFG